MVLALGVVNYSTTYVFLVLFLLCVSYKLLYYRSNEASIGRSFRYFLLHFQVFKVEVGDV